MWRFEKVFEEAQEIFGDGPRRPKRKGLKRLGNTNNRDRIRHRSTRTRNRTQNTRVLRRRVPRREK